MHRKMRLQKGDFHLDIGCGWGTLINFSVANYGTIGTGVTLSRNQTAYAVAVSKKKKIRDHRTTFWCRCYFGFQAWASFMLYVTLF